MLHKKNDPRSIELNAKKDILAGMHILPAKRALSVYLEKMGVVKELQQKYFDNIIYQQDLDLKPEILADGEYQKLAKNYLTANLQYEGLKLVIEDQAMDMANQLSAVLGKPPRGNYHDIVLFAPEIERLSKGARSETYTESPASIRARNPLSTGISVSPEVNGHPLLTGEMKPVKVNIIEMQEKWNAEFNADTKNITSDEWRVIEAMRKAFIGERSVEQITVADKKDINGKIDKLKASFNRTSGNDGLTREVITIIPQATIPMLPKAITQSGWRF